MMNPFSWLQMTNMISYQGLVRTFPRSEDTLDAMYRGAVRKANDTLHGGELFQAQIAIERALNQCQQDFDTSLLGITRKANHALKSQEPCKKYSPEDELRRLLNGLG